jgi:hypothetical protein
VGPKAGLDVLNLYSSPNIARDILSRKISWAGYAAFKRNKKSSYKIMVQHLTDIWREDADGIPSGSGQETLSGTVTPLGSIQEEK